MLPMLALAMFMVYPADLPPRPPDENANGVLSDILSSECLVAVGLVISIPCPLPISIKASPNMVVCEFTFIVSGTSIFLLLILTGMQV